MRNNQPVVDVEIKFPEDPNAKIISVTDTHGIITDVNQTFIDMCGFSREELIGQPHNIIRHPDMPSTKTVVTTGLMPSLFLLLMEAKS